MAATFIADIFSPEVLGDQVSARFPDMLVLGNTNLVQVDSTFALGSPGTKFTMPFWKRIGAFLPLNEGTAMSPGKITTGKENATVQRAGLALEVLDTAELVSKADPVGEIADQIARRAAEYIDAALVVQLGNTPNVFDQTTNANKTLTGSTAGTVNQNTIIASMTSTVGDNFMKLLSGGKLIMHSKVYGDLVQTGAIQNQYQSGEDVIRTGMIPTLMGLPIVLSDLVTITPAFSAVAAKYQTFIVGPESLALFYQRQVMVEFDRDILLLADVISSNVHFAPHLYGYDDVTATVVAEQSKSVHVVNLTSF